MKWYLRAWKQYAVFSGRASRTEYWMFILFNFLVICLLMTLAILLQSATKTNQLVLVLIYYFAMLIPYFAVGYRRIHDTDHDGLWLFVPIVSLILLASKGTEGNNRFGPDPLGRAQEVEPT